MEDEVTNFLSKNNEIRSKGIECFGSEEKLKRWLSSSTYYSQMFLKSRSGRVIDMPTSEILDEIGRIEYGTFF